MSGRGLGHAIRIVKQWHAMGRTAHAIARYLGQDVRWATAQIEKLTLRHPPAPEAQPPRKKAAGDGLRMHRVISSGEPPNVRPPKQVIVERDARLSRTPTLNEVMFGDPPPGRSALDQKSGAAS